MKLLVGTSGYSFEAWRGAFYPTDMPSGQMLSFYAEHFCTVEINNTFYRMPRSPVVESWARQVPSGFRFSMKAPRRITHIRRLKGVGEEIDRLLRAIAPLGKRLGALLFQLPPKLERDDALLSEFMGMLPANLPAAFEFRHPSWQDGEVYEALRKRDFALCTADTDTGATPLVATAKWGYLRLRRGEYGEEDLAGWLGKLRDVGWEKVFVYFKHEDEAKGVMEAKSLMRLAREEGEAEVSEG